MSSAYPVASSRPYVPHIRSQCGTCNLPLEFPVPSPIPPQGTFLRVQCCKCQTVYQHAFYPVQLPSVQSSATASSTNGSSGSSGAGRRSRKIGTQEKPLETGYYDLLGVPIDATTDDIKKSYSPSPFLALHSPSDMPLGRLAIKHHPDKNPDDPHAEERFKEIAIAYQTLSDPDLRKKYNEFGPKESAPEGGFVDPEEVFSAIFGGDRFIPIIGQISLARDMKTALQEADEAEGEEGKEVKRDAKGKEILSDEEKARREEKEKKANAEVISSIAHCPIDGPKPC